MRLTNLRFLATRQSVKTFWRSIKGKIFLVFASTFLSVCALALVNSWSMTMVKKRVLLLEHYEDFLSNILEVRRFEKNYLFYKDRGSLQESLEYLENIDALFFTLSKDIAQLIGQPSYLRMKRTLEAYQANIEGVKNGAEPDLDAIRELGKELVEAADSLLRTKRQRIHRAIVRTAAIPFAPLGIFVLLMILIIKLISIGLLKPLSMVQVTTERVARGDFRPIPFQAGQIEEISGLIGAFNRMARELEINQEDLLQAKKIAALGTFTAGIAHELNNPINNISLTADSLEELYAEQLDQDGKEMIRDIALQAERAGDIVRNLLDFSRTERPLFKLLTITHVIRSTLNLIKNQLMVAGIKLGMDIPEDLPPVQGNLRNLQQVFMNILLNAISATPAGGRIDITGHEENTMIRVDVRDTGAGINPEVQQHIFEPFFTTKEVGKGTGLGLAVTYSIVQRHGGKMEVNSEEGKGTIFSVHLPKAKEAPA